MNAIGKTGENPHVWYIPSALPSLANDIADQLSKMDPGHVQQNEWSDGFWNNRNLSIGKGDDLSHTAHPLFSTCSKNVVEHPPRPTREHY